jgi:hypothetical protein
MPLDEIIDHMIIVCGCTHCIIKVNFSGVNLRCDYSTSKEDLQEQYESAWLDDKRSKS